MPGTAPDQRRKIMKEQEKVKYVEYLALADELRKIASEGTDLMLEGRGANAEKIATTCVFSEGCDYMRDYINDGERRLNFNMIRNK